MVAAKWHWGVGHMLANFGRKAALGIIISNLVYLLCFRRDFRALAASTAASAGEAARPGKPVPVWITLVHLLLLL